MRERPAIVVKLRSTDSYVVNQTTKSSPPVALCNECGLEALHQAQKAVGVGVVTEISPMCLHEIMGGSCVWSSYPILSKSILVAT